MRLDNVKLLEQESGNRVVVSRSGDVSLLDQVGRERERYKLPYGAVLTVHAGDVVDPGTKIASWDPHTPGDIRSRRTRPIRRYCRR